MRGMKERAPQPRRTGGEDADERWAKAPCTDLARSSLWDLDHDGNGEWARAESREQRRQRHENAKAECLDCPALALCTPQPGQTGVIAGKVVTK